MRTFVCSFYVENIMLNEFFTFTIRLVSRIFLCVYSVCFMILMGFSGPSLGQGAKPNTEQRDAPISNAISEGDDQLKVLPPTLMEEVFVTASPLSERGRAFAQATNSLSGDALRQRAAATLGETLDGELGLASASFGPGVGMPVIRGQSANRVKVMQDGVDSLDASNASPDHANGIEPLLAEKIEVLRGPSTLRYGAGAIGGVVNVIDKRVPKRQPDGIEGGVEWRSDSVNQSRVAIFSVAGALGDSWALYADGLYRQSEDLTIPGYARQPKNPADIETTTKGYIDNTDAEATSGSIGVSWIGTSGFIGVSVNQLNNEYGIPSGGHIHTEHTSAASVQGNAFNDEEEEEALDVRIVLQQTRYDIKGEWLQPFLSFERASIRLGVNDYQHREVEYSAGGAATGTRFINKGYEGRVELEHSALGRFDSDVDTDSGTALTPNSDRQSFGSWQGAVGIQWLSRDFSALGEESFIPQSAIEQGGIFWLEEWSIKPEVVVELGLRADRQKIVSKAEMIEPVHVVHSQHPELEGDHHFVHHTANASASVRWNYSARQTLRLSWTHAERAPSVEELLSNGAHIATNSIDHGNPNLVVESSRNWDLGWQWQDHENNHQTGLLGLGAKINLFHNRVDDFIYKRHSGEFDHGLALYDYRQGDAVFKGLEAELTLPLSKHLSLRLWGDSVRGYFNHLEGDSAEIPRLPPRRIGSALIFEHNDWTAQLSWLEAEKQNRPGDYEATTAGYHRVDARMSYRLGLNDKSALFFIKGHNLLNEEIRHATSYLREIAPAGGRGIELGVRFDF